MVRFSGLVNKREFSRPMQGLLLGDCAQRSNKHIGGEWPLRGGHFATL